MIPEDTPSRGPLKTYVFRSAEYLHNAYVSLDQEELEKASELLWGSMALAVKAVAALREIELRSHAAIWEYARQLSQELGDLQLFDAFRDANRLHSNFYESDLTREVTLSSEERVRIAIGRLLSMVPREALE
jgi:uncharacterized protein (UPF0332 family)